MGKTLIEWTDKVWNPITGCSPVSDGCLNCYAKRMAYRLKGRYGYSKDDPFKVTFHPERLDGPLHWKKPSRIFVCSMGDLFHEDVKEEWLRRIIFEMMRSPNKHTFLVLTKRPKGMAEFIEWYGSHAIWGGPRPGFLNDFPRIWLGVSIEDQKTADERIPILLKIPAAKRFVSVEPMLGPVDISNFIPPTKSPESICICDRKKNNYTADNPYCKWPHGKKFLDWIICGGETGPKARPIDLEWAHSLRDQCRRASVPFFFKQVGGNRETPPDLMTREFPL